MNGLITLFIEFFKIGLFSIGGGLATLPFLYKLADKYAWFDYAKIADMVAISESTPGPLGVNMATYTGFQSSGVLGSIVATVGLVMPSVIIIIWVSKFLEKFRQNKHVDDVFYILRPAVTGLIAAAGFGVVVSAIFHPELLQGFTMENIMAFVGLKEAILFIVMLFLTNKFKRHPIVYIASAGAIGILFAF